MLLRFYLFFLVFNLLILSLSLKRGQRETIVRGLTLLLLLHILCLTLWLGTLGFAILMAIGLAFSLSELAQYYEPRRFILHLSSWLFFGLLIYNEGLIGWTTPLIGIVSISAFSGSYRPQSGVSQILGNRAKTGGIRGDTPYAFPNFGTHPPQSRYVLAFTLGFVVPCAAFLVVLMKQGQELILALILLLQLNDIVAYLIGKRWGKTKLFPNISPNKSLEGYLAGGGGIIIGLMLLHTYIPILAGQPIYKDIILFFVLLVAGNLGDLLFSSLKRRLAIKDFSTMLPGHGGTLDRLDNLFFLAPIFYFLAIYDFFG